MAAANIITVIGTGITPLFLILDNVPSGADQTKLSYIIANDGANGELSSAVGHLPDVRLWDETAEFLGANYDGSCGEGVITCTTVVNAQETATCTLFSGNNDAICIAWTELSWTGVLKKYYAETQVPSINYQEDVFCVWVDKNGDLPATGFQVHWPEFDGDNSPQQSLDYYCRKRPPVCARPLRARRIGHMSPAASPQAEKKRKQQQEKVKRAEGERLAKRFEKDSRIVKSYSPNQLPTELCNPGGHAAGQIFVSYEENKFCYMPTKTVYSICEATEEGACWSVADNEEVVRDSRTARLPPPDMGHISKVIAWGSE